MAVLKGFFRFWYDFLVGDDWTIACGVVVVLAAGATVVRWFGFDSHVLTVVLALVVMGLFAVSLLTSGRRGGE
jgi:hypothetical protein